MSFKNWRDRKKERFEMLVGWRSDSFPYEPIEPRDHGVWSILIFVLWLPLSLFSRGTAIASLVLLASAIGVAGWYHMTVSRMRLLDKYEVVCDKLKAAEREVDITRAQLESARQSQ